jgi:4-alpha-glucanotransferase
MAMADEEPQAGRLSGILLHPSSLPSRGGIGDFGPVAYEFIDWLAAARQGLWQVLPLGPLGLGNSPYSSISAFAGNPLLVSLERLADRGWIDPARLHGLPETSGDIDYAQVVETKLPLLHEAAGSFLANAAGSARKRFEEFKQSNCWWLDDFVLFMALRNRYPNGAWNIWPEGFARRDASLLERFRDEQKDSLEIDRVVQFAFWEQWRALRHACRRRGIRILGDIAIFVNYDSSDVWTHPEIFQLDEKLEPAFVAGVPPDAFSATGQRWGNPLYRWDVLRQQGYDWWIRRMRWAIETCDVIRLDHFRGFQQYWKIPSSEETAIHGEWTDGPSDELFHAMEHALGKLPLIAEDLGHITPDVHALRQRLGIPGMRVMQFGFGRHAHKYLPHWFDSQTVAYTGTHDNDTTLGWWQNHATPDEKRDARSYLGVGDSDIPWAFVRAVITSQARYCIAPMQDILGLGSEARMNVPSRPDGNWMWRYQPGALTSADAERLSRIVEVSDRIPEHSEADTGLEFMA